MPGTSIAPCHAMTTIGHDQLLTVTGGNYQQCLLDPHMTPQECDRVYYNATAKEKAEPPQRDRGHWVIQRGPLLPSTAPHSIGAGYESRRGAHRSSPPRRRRQDRRPPSAAFASAAPWVGPELARGSHAARRGACGAASQDGI